MIKLIKSNNKFSKNPLIKVETNISKEFVIFDIL
jgi:hypothetical protein